MPAAVALEEKKLKVEKIYTFQEYLKKEEKTIEKHEFYNGQIIKRAGVKYQHNLVAGNIITALNNLIDTLSHNYLVLNSDQKIYIEAENICVYPDALVLSEVPVFWNCREDTITNPLLIVEVLSRSTATHDRTAKFMLYKTLPSFKEYVIINPNKASVETWFKQDEKTWINLTETDLSKEIFLKSMGVSVKLSNIYKRVEFE